MKKLLAAFLALALLCVLAMSASAETFTTTAPG